MQYLFINNKNLISKLYFKKYKILKNQKHMITTPIFSTLSNEISFTNTSFSFRLQILISQQNLKKTGHPIRRMISQATLISQKFYKRYFWKVSNLNTMLPSSKLLHEESDSTNGTTIFKTPTNTRISSNESTMLPSSRLLHEELSGPVNGTTTPKTLTNTRTSTNESTTLPSTTVDEVVRNDDDPPPYSPIAPPNHVGWPFDFSGNRYSAYNTTTYTAPLAPFQTSLTSPGFGFHTERAEEHASISMPCRLFMFGSRRSLFPHDGPTFTDNISINKEDNESTTRSEYTFIYMCRFNLSIVIILTKLKCIIQTNSLCFKRNILWRLPNLSEDEDVFQILKWLFFI